MECVFETHSESVKRVNDQNINFKLNYYTEDTKRVWVDGMDGSRSKMIQTLDCVVMGDGAEELTFELRAKR